MTTRDQSAPAVSTTVPVRPGAIQVHIDPTWAIAKTFGGNLPDEDFVYRKTVSLLLELLAEQDLKATFFVIGNDLKIEANRKVVGSIARAGHEIGNHSLTHPIGFRQLKQNEKEREIVAAEEMIEDVTGVKPRGFAAPAYDIDEATLSILERRGYLYDTSVYPTWFSVAAKAYRHFKTRLYGRGEPASARPSSWGGLGCAFAPRSPYFPAPGSLLRKATTGILEIPLSTIPAWGTPFYNYFCLFAGRWYFRTGLRMLLWAGRPLNYLIHPTELFDPDDLKEGRKYMISSRTSDLPFEWKLSFLRFVLGEIKSLYRIVPLEEMAGRIVEADRSEKSKRAGLSVAPDPPS